MRRTLDVLLEALILLDDRVGRGKHSSDGPPARSPGQGARVGRCLRPDGDHAPVGAAAVGVHPTRAARRRPRTDRKSTRLNSSHANISYAVFCLKKKKRVACPWHLLTVRLCHYTHL